MIRFALLLIAIIMLLSGEPMVAPITYSLQLDTARDGTFAQAIDDVTQYWIGQAQWNNGMGGSYDEVAPPARLTVQLSNRGGVFDREGYLSGELLTNGGFDNWTGAPPNDTPDGWTTFETVLYTGLISQVNPDQSQGGGAGTGACNIYSNGSGRPYISQSVFAPGKTYRVSIPITSDYYVAAGVPTRQHQTGIRAYTTGDVAISDVFNEPNNHVFYFLPQSGQTTLKIMPVSTKAIDDGGGNGFGGICDLTIDNVSVREVPQYAMVNKGMQVRLRATYNGVTSTLFQGRISQIQPSAGRSTEPTISLTIEDAMLELLDAEYAPPLLIAPTADIALQRMFDDAVIRWPYSGSWWLLGVSGNSELGYSTYLYDHTVTNFETGITVFEYLGDVEDRGEGISAQGFIRDIIAAEAGGRFWFDTRTNKLKFTNRDHDPLNATITATYNESHFDSVTPKYGEDIVNDLTLTYTSRDVGAEGSVLWTLKSVPFLLKNNNKRTFNARYFDANNEQLHVGARTTVTPVMGIDYTANTLGNGSGTVVSDRITVWTEPSGNSAKITVSNNSGLDIYVTLLQLRGTPITYIEERYQTVDGSSIAANELYPKVIDVRALDNTSLAERFGDYVVAKFKDPIFRFETAAFNSLNGDTMTDASVNRLIGDKITITDSSTNHNRDYLIVGEQHMLTIGGDHPRDVTWILKPAERETFWVLGVVGKSELDLTTRLSL